jgi:hypothetical protein
VGGHSVFKSDRFFSCHCHGAAVSSLAIAMAPRKPLASTEAEAKAQGNTTLFDTWRRPRAGRPKKSGNLASDKIVVKANDTKQKKKPGPVPKPKHATRQKTTANDDGILPDAQKPMQKRSNWAKGENLLKMTSAVKNWEDKTGEALDSNGEKLGLSACRDSSSVNQLTGALSGHCNLKDEPGGAQERIGTDCRKERGNKKRADA